MRPVSVLDDPAAFPTVSTNARRRNIYPEVYKSPMRDSRLYTREYTVGQVRRGARLGHPPTNQEGMMNLVDWRELSAEERNTWAPEAPVAVLHMPNDVYHRGLGVSVSRIKKLQKSAHAYAQNTGPDMAGPVLAGTLAHEALAQRKPSLPDSYVVLPKTDDGKDMIRNPKHKAYQEFLAKAGERTVIRESEWAEAVELAERVKAHPVVAAYLDDPGCDVYAEISLYWRDEGGLLLRCRPDVLVVPRDATSSLMCFDLKTVRDADMKVLRRHGEYPEVNWPLCSVWYVSGVRAVFGRPCSWVVIAAERETGGEVLLYAYSLAGCVTPVHEVGDAVMRRLLRQLAEHMDSGVWPRQSDEIRAMEPSKFVLEEHLNNMEEPDERDIRPF